MALKSGSMVTVVMLQQPRELSVGVSCPQRRRDSGGWVPGSSRTAAVGRKGGEGGQGAPFCAGVRVPGLGSCRQVPLRWRRDGAGTGLVNEAVLAPAPSHLWVVSFPQAYKKLIHFLCEPNVSVSTEELCLMGVFLGSPSGFGSCDGQASLCRPLGGAGLSVCPSGRM